MHGKRVYAHIRIELHDSNTTYSPPDLARHRQDAVRLVEMDQAVGAHVSSRRYPVQAVARWRCTRRYIVLSHDQQVRLGRGDHHGTKGGYSQARNLVSFWWHLFGHGRRTRQVNRAPLFVFFLHARLPRKRQVVGDCLSGGRTESSSDSCLSGCHS